MKKTKVVILTKKKIPTISPLLIRDVIVETKPMGKYPVSYTHLLFVQRILTALKFERQC